MGTIGLPLTVIDARNLLTDLTRQLKRLEDDLRRRIAELPELDTALRAEWQASREAERCAESFESWEDQLITQAGVDWLLPCVFLRFIEDNRLVDRPWLSGPPEGNDENEGSDAGRPVAGEVRTVPKRRTTTTRHPVSQWDNNGTRIYALTCFETP